MCKMESGGQDSADEAFLDQPEWVTATQEAIRTMEERCSTTTTTPQNGGQKSEDPLVKAFGPRVFCTQPSLERKDRPKSDSSLDNEDSPGNLSDRKSVPDRLDDTRIGYHRSKSLSVSFNLSPPPSCQKQPLLRNFSPPISIGTAPLHKKTLVTSCATQTAPVTALTARTCLGISDSDIRFIDESTRSSLSASPGDQLSDVPNSEKRSLDTWSNSDLDVFEKNGASPRYCDVVRQMSNPPGSEWLPEGLIYPCPADYDCPHVPPCPVLDDGMPNDLKGAMMDFRTSGVLHLEKHELMSDVEGCSDGVTFSYPMVDEPDGQSSYSAYLERDFRYYFQHPYSRLFISYFVILCNFLIFSEDPVSHSHTECEIPLIGNVFSFIATKYPPEHIWIILKVSLWLFAMFGGLICGKYFIHHFLFRNVFRLKMFRDEQGTWVIQYLTVILFVYVFSLVYNAFLLSGHPNPEPYRISALMGITHANFMKAAACGTWLGDFLTAWMVTDLMFQDNLYPGWATPIRNFWRTHTRVRICVFWGGSIGMTALVVTMIVSDEISWDTLNRDFFGTTELSRAFLASFILVMDLLIVMQDWDFPHFVCDLDIKLPGMHAAAFHPILFRRQVNMPEVVFHISGKWFNYGIIMIVMVLDLNMWKNQIFYSPEEYGQYVGPDYKVYTVSDKNVLATGNYTLWTYEYRSEHINPLTNLTYNMTDMKMNSRYLNYPMSAKGMAFLPSLIGFALFGLLIFFYGRFPTKTDETTDDRIKETYEPRSSWRRERGSTHRRRYGSVSLGCADEEKLQSIMNRARHHSEVVVAWKKAYESPDNCMEQGT